LLIIACISSHGFGHGSRVAALLQELHRLAPSCRFVLSTKLPEAFLHQAFAGLNWIHRPCRWDVGVIQADALGTDAQGTLMALEDLQAELPSLLQEEADWLHGQILPGEAAVVLGDIPPAAALLAERLALPLIWQANFGWDSIYGSMGPDFQEWSEQCRHLYGRGQRLLECPFALPMPWGIEKVSLGLSCGHPAHTEKELRSRFNWQHQRQRTALLSFGGMGLAVSPRLLELWPQWCFVVVDPELAQVANAWLLPADLRPLDLMPLCGLVITKPGYSTFCEALSQGLGMVVVERQGFIEAEVLQKGLQCFGWHQKISREAFELGLWRLDEPLQAPSGSPLPADGAEQGARALLELLAK
jgi:hypothetical protein